MYIKQVVIEGFKSYKEQIATEPFSPKVNCVVGANGSGKSNFFHAIRFVLSDLYQNLRNEDRHSLLHEGAGHQVVSAFVEIVFDNSDNRIPVDKEEVRLRRTIGLKKDEYFLDGKHITKTEVMNLLESAGFSRSNPYYVVQQGKISSLTLMKDSERLDLLKEIGGTRVYEERRRESNKRKQIIQVVQYLDERLKELDEEKEELRKYQQLDKQRKSLEYAIYSKEVQDAQQKLMEIEEARAKVSETSAKKYNDVLDAHEKIKDLENTLKDVAKELQNSNKEKESIEKRRTKALKKHTELELDVKDLQEKITGNIRAKEDAARQLKILEKNIQDSNDELEKIRPKYEEQVMEEKEITKRIMEREKQLSILYQKQGRATQFPSKAARDKWLRKEIEDLEREKMLLEEIGRLKGELDGCDETIEKCRSQITTLQSHIDQSRQGFNKYKVQRDKLQDKRKSLWDKENTLTAEIDKLRAEVEKAEKSLDHAIPGDVRRGMNSVRKICREYNISGVYGPIIELLSCEEKFFTAVEVTAGNSLFHVVVENDDTSTQIIRHLNAHKGGRVTFIPLNRVRAPRITYPQSSDVIPLLKKLNFKHDYNPAFSQVFARTVVCKNLDVASRVARTDGLDCITLDGSMTGGFYDHRRSKLKFMNIIKQNEDEIHSKEEELMKIDQKITELVSEQQKIEAECAHGKSEMEQFKQDIANANKQKQLISKALSKKELKEQLVACKTDRIETEARKAELETNLTTNLRRRKQELEAVISSADDDTLGVNAGLKAQELSDAKLLVDDATQQLRRVSDSISARSKEIKQIKEEINKLKSLEDEYERKLQEETKELEQLLSKKKIYSAKEEEYTKKIRELGRLTSDAFETYKRRNIKELHKALHRCNDQLQQFSHVNKKALDQYINFTEQREELQKRQAELDAGDEKIRELISVLDQRKDESIERTFKGVAWHFQKVFSELVPGDDGLLFMMKKKEGGHDDDEDGTREANPEGFFYWTRRDTVLKQLSGGQKTVVALTLIFAIQRCDPAPFYIFDEIDAALDPQYRTAVGNMIRRLADFSTTQFITTTFCPELVKVADKIYGVTHKSRVHLTSVI
ncbi:hypothetical protein Ahy_A07g031603 isoform H [Arachis hypogaea]|uniref:SMC hinge domain-containing protein n=1 Tax=Arachis hypogaea TaxID=3818 RepID=A0A445C4L3_ARAHY|nr:hypothetical protein Ahy_A07g031603 isoform H [Arachis hypogaea]